MSIRVKPAVDAVAQMAMKEATATRRAFASGKAHAEGPGDSGGEAAGPPERSPPVPIYTVGIETLAADASGALDSAEQFGWRVLTTHNGERQLVDLMGNDENAEPVAVLRSESAEMFAKAGVLAEKSVEPHVDYEVRVLDLGRLGMASLWLHNDDPDTPDHFFTLEAEPKELTTEKMLGTAHERAQRRVRIDAEAREAAKRVGKPSDLGG